MKKFQKENAKERKIRGRKKKEEKEKKHQLKKREK